MIMLRAGIPLTRAIEFLSAQTSNKNFAKILQELVVDISKGVSFSDALARWPKVFDYFFVSMVKAAETVGILDESLTILAEDLEKSKNLRSKIIEAVIYPAIIIVLMIAISLFLVFFVFPQILNLYNNLNIRPPLLTKIFLTLITFTVNNAKYLFSGAFALIGGLFGFIKFTTVGAKTFDWTILRLPIFGTLSRKINAAKFSRSLTALLKGGVALPQALEITAQTLSNIYFKSLVLKTAQDVRRGEKLSISLNSGGKYLFPLLVTQMIGVGEETGSLNALLKHLTDFYDDEVRTVIASLTTTIEPILMIVVGVGVAFIAISTVQLLYSFLQF